MSSSIAPVPPKFLAQLFNITVRRVQQLAQEGIIPKAEKGNYQLLPSIKGYIHFLQECSKQSKGNQNEELLKNRIRLEKAKADQAELDLALRLGALVIAEDVEDMVGTMIANFKARILAIPAAIAAQGTGLKKGELEDVCRKLIYEALNELKGYHPEPTESA